MSTQNNFDATSGSFISSISSTLLTASGWTLQAERKWRAARERFLAAVVAELRAAVDGRLDDLGARGTGLRTWLAAIAWRDGVMPIELPRSLVQLYLDDPEARPLHECEGCGLLIPIRPARRRGAAIVPMGACFSHCPKCGGKTGWYLFRSKTAAENRGFATAD